MAGTYDHPMAGYGRSDDRMMAHVAPGEQIVPKPVLDANPRLAYYIARAIRDAGANPKQYHVGGDEMSINPYTGQPEFGFFSKIFKVVKKAAPIILPIAGAAIGGPAGAAIGGAVGGGINGGVKGAVIGAGAGYLGGSAVSGGLGSIGSNLGSVGQVLGAVNSAQSVLGGKSQNQVLKQQAVAPPAAQAPAFTPTKPSPLSRPESLGGLAGFSPEQERSALATKGLNGGLGQDENNYYKNLIQRSLIGDNNQVATDNPNFLMPIEGSYFSQQGQNTSDIMEFLKGLQG